MSQPGKFRKKPVVIEAMQLVCFADLIDAATWIRANGGTCSRGDDTITIQTLEGNMVAGWRDWIIRGVKGEFYPCKPDIFEATYEQDEP